MKIKNLEGLTTGQITIELAQGAKFVVFEYAISIIIMTFRRSSDIYFIRAGESAVAKSLPYTLLTVFFGWWGIPWGPIYSFASLFNNLKGGKDVTQDILATANAR